MAINLQLKNDAKSTLLTAITAADLSATLAVGGGALFPALAGSQYFYGTFQDSLGNREIVKVTARAGDVLTIGRNQESSGAKAFPAGSLFQLRLTAGGLAVHWNEMAADAPTIGGDGAGATAIDFNPVNNKVIAQATAPTITATSERILALTPAGAITQTLPTGATILQGTCIRIVNLASVAGRNITVNSSSGALVWLVCPSNHCVVMALQDNPTTAAHWVVIDHGWPLRAQVQSEAAQANLTSGTVVQWDTVNFDPAGLFTDASDRFTINLPGRYRIYWSVPCDPDSAEGVTFGAFVDGALASPKYLHTQTTVVGAFYTAIGQAISGNALVVGQFITVVAITSPAGTLDLPTSGTRVFGIEWVSP